MQTTMQPNYQNTPALINSHKPASSFFLAPDPISTFIIIDDHHLEALGLKVILQNLRPHADIFIAQSYPEGQALIEEKLTKGRVDLIVAHTNEPNNSLAHITQLRNLYPHICLAVSGSGEINAGATSTSTVLKYLEVGATGYFSKSECSELTSQAFEKILKGNIYIPPCFTEKNADIETPDNANQQPLRAQPFSGLVSLSSKQYLHSLLPAKSSHVYAKPRSTPSHLAPRVTDISVNDRYSTNGIITGDAIGLTHRQVDVLDFILLGLSNKRICRELNLAEGTVKVHVSAVLRALGAKTRTQAVVAASNLGLKSRMV
jgi:DNA-binding NarL/FixJ family response regulator